MTLHSKKFRMSFALSFILSVAFVQVTNAQADPRYQYQQRNSGTPSNSETTTPPLGTAIKTQAPLAPTQTVPFDGGLSLFVLAGAGIAAKKRYDKRKKQLN
jgi:hypothetical protein